MIVKANSIIPLELCITDQFGVERIDITSVYARVYHRSLGSIVEDLSSTLMLGSGSLWYYSYSSSLSVGEYIIEYVITDNSGVAYVIVDPLTVGYLEADLSGKPTLTQMESSTIIAKEATLSNATYGLSALKDLIDAIDTSTELQAKFTEIKGAGWSTETLKAIKTVVDSIEVTDLSALSTKVDQVKTKTDTINWLDITLIKNIESGRWRIDTSVNQMIFYSSDGITPILTFNLFDKDRKPTSDTVAERVPV